MRNGAGGLGWSATGGPGLLALHIPPTHWGYNAREHSYDLLGYEFAQAHLGDPISDESIETFAWWIINVVWAANPSVPLYLPMHSELAAGIRDGKTDAAPRGSVEADELRARILARL